MDKDIRTEMENIYRRIKAKEEEERMEIDSINESLNKLLTDDEHYPLSQGYVKVFKPLIDKVNNGEFGRSGTEKKHIIEFVLDFVEFAIDKIDCSLENSLVRGYVATDLRKANKNLSNRIELILEAYRGFADSPRGSELDIGAFLTYQEDFYKGYMELVEEYYDEYNRFIMLSYFENRLLCHYQKSVFFEVHELIFQ